MNLANDTDFRAISAAYYEAARVSTLSFSEYDAHRIWYRATPPDEARAIAEKARKEAQRVYNRQVAELRMIRKAVRALRGKGYMISVNNGEGYAIKRSTREGDIMRAVHQCDEESLVVRDADGRFVGSVLLVYGNADDGSEVIADYSLSLSDVLDEVTA